MRVLVGVKRAVDYATKVRVLPDKSGVFNMTINILPTLICIRRRSGQCENVHEPLLRDCYRGSYKNEGKESCKRGQQIASE
jgi:hypothetical protein